MTNKEWVRLHTMVVDAQNAFKDLEEFHGSDMADNVEAELDAFSECVNTLKMIVEKLNELVKEKEKVE